MKKTQRFENLLITWGGCGVPLALARLAIVASVLCLGLNSQAQAGRIDSGVGLDEEANRSMEIKCGDDVIGTLAIDEYFAWNSGPFEDGMVSFNPENPGLPDDEDTYENRAGAKMEAIFAQTNDMFDCDFRWIQGVMDGVGTIGTPPYLDPFNRDDGLPFYWTEAENANASYGNGGKRFSDIPSQDKTNDGNSIHFEAAFVAVDLENMKVHYLKGFTWGYEVEDDETSTLDTFAWRTTPTAALMTLVTDWDASDTSPYTGDDEPDGWMWTDDCLCTKVPEPASIMMFTLGLAVVLTSYRRRAPWGCKA